MTTINKYPASHKDSFGFLGTALNGVTQWTPAAFRSTGIVLNEIAKGDVFTYNIQLNHDYNKGVLDGFHIHYIPMTNNSGNVAFTYEWGIYSIGDTIGATLTHTGGSISMPIATAQYKHQYFEIIGNMTPVEPVSYSAFVLVRVSRLNTGADTFTGNIALLGADVHYVADRFGSFNEYTD